MQAHRGEPRDVREIDEQRRADFASDLGERLVLHGARIRARTGDDQFRLVLPRQRAHFVEVDQFGIFAHAVGDRVVQFAREANLRSVREVAAVRQRHAEHGVARLQHRHEDRHVGLRSGVRLHVGVLRPEELSEAFEREPLGDVDPLAAAVVPLAGIPFGVLVGHHARVGFADRAAGVVLRRDQLEILSLPALLARDRREDLGIGGFDGSGRENFHESASLGIRAPVPCPIR